MNATEWLLIAVGASQLLVGFLLGCWFRQGAVDSSLQRVREVVGEFSGGYMKGFLAGVKAERQEAYPALADAWDEGFTAHSNERALQRADPSRPIARTNPYREKAS